jgi:ribosome maturation factor RimP
MDPTARVDQMIAPALEAMGYSVVRVRYTGGDHPVLQIMAERTADGTMSIDDCTEVSRTVSALLDVEDPIPGHYNLEVSSPGLDRPLVRIGDFDRFTGYEAKVELAHPLDGRKRFRGALIGVEDETVKMATDEGEVALPFAEIAAAKLVLTDELIAASLKQQNS